MLEHSKYTNTFRSCESCFIEFNGKQKYSNLSFFMDYRSCTVVSGIQLQPLFQALGLGNCFRDLGLGNSFQDLGLGNCYQDLGPGNSFQPWFKEAAAFSLSTIWLSCSSRVFWKDFRVYPSNFPMANLSVMLADLTRSAFLNLHRAPAVCLLVIFCCKNWWCEAFPDSPRNVFVAKLGANYAKKEL